MHQETAFGIVVLVFQQGHGSSLWHVGATGSITPYIPLMIELGLARTGKLVTRGALILMFAFLVVSTSPGYEIKPLAIGIAAGIIFDASRTSSP